MLRDRTGLRVVLRRGVLPALAPVLAGLWVAGTRFGGSLWPWRPAMVDLDVYRRAGRLLLAGGDVYDLPGQLPFLYPPFAALLAVPLALLPAAVVQLGWTVAGVLALLAVLHRYGLRRAALSLVGTGAVLFVEPVEQTLAFGQLGIFLVALVLLDLAPGPRVLGPRRLPEGTLTALAAAVKLTPGIFWLYLVVVGRRRAALVTAAVFVGVSLLTAVVLPSASLTFWGRLAHGDTGLGHSIIYYTNQSVMADVVRVLGLGSAVAAAGLALSAVVAVLGVWAGARWHRRGEERLGLALCGVAGLLASPVSWLHHFVWVVPLALSLLPAGLRPGLNTSGLGSTVPDGLRVLGWVFVGWVVVAPFTHLPNGADLELLWTGPQQLLASVTALLGTALLVAAGVLAGGPGRRVSRGTAPPRS